ncbi:hypothetical protein Bca52824_058941 [Brassica carinata]|uniref:Pentatricopeptide repeat-containing protein n=1 Tax=Brassica carinata TaxID=52824 RepID=A0A8X7QUI5_BRACI|nr:hypothetical protein Bca52824_058941 [Brassica carinata]
MAMALYKVSLMEYWFKQRKDEEAMEIYKVLDMSEQMNDIVGNRVLRVLVEHGKKTEAWELFDEIIGFCYPETFGIMMKSFSDEKTIPLSWASETCYRTIIACLCEQGKMSEAEEFFAKMFSNYTAARYSRLAVFSKPDDEPEVAVHTCETIIGSMVRAKRHKDAYDLYDYFFNKHTLKPNSSCCNHIIESRLQQGLVDEALDFHRTVKGMVPDYPSEASLRVLTKGLVHSGRFDLAQALLKGSSKMFPDHVNV